MKTFLAEYRNDYSTYTFSYALYALAESRSELPALYAEGFLPFTNRLDVERDLFYKARSLRVDLQRFANSSENRRVDRLVSPLKIGVTPTPKAEFDLSDPNFLAFCQAYAEERFSGGSLSPERLAYILRRDCLTHFLTFHAGDGTVLGYVFAGMEGEAFHYWYAFFDTAYLENYPLGKWIMWRTLCWAQEQGVRYAYLGTCYTPKALYKVRDHKGCEFYDGIGWNPDMSLLKQLCAEDVGETPRSRDLFKETEHPVQTRFQTLWEATE